MSSALTLPTDAGSELEDPMVVLQEWIAEPDTQAAFVRMANGLREIALADNKVLLPDEGQATALSKCMAHYREYFASDLERLFRREFPSHYRVLRPRIIRQIAVENVWPLVEPWLRSFFVRALAAAWAHEKIGDAVTVADPSFENGSWVVPVGLARFSDPLGQVILDEEGNVVAERSDTKAEFLSRVRRAH